jgi:2'-5' RNA ligase
MRMFIAAELPQQMVEALSETSAALRETVRGRYVGSDQFHVTLAFLGEVEVARIPELEDILGSACADRQPIEVMLGELGSFGRDASATLWQGLTGDGTRQLSDLATSLRSGLRQAGFSFDAKGFLPHITLMRQANLPRAAAEHGGLPMPTVARGSIDTITLFQSELFRDRRPRYTALCSVRLVG